MVFLWAFLMFLSMMLSAAFFAVTHTFHTHWYPSIVFLPFYVLACICIEILILYGHEYLHDWAAHHPRLSPIPRAFMLTLWILLVLFLRAIGETSPQAVAFWFFLTAAVFCGTRIVRPGSFDGGLFTFCCGIFGAQGLLTFGPRSLYTYLLVVGAWVFHAIDSILTARDIESAVVSVPSAETEADTLLPSPTGREMVSHTGLGPSSQPPAHAPAQALAQALAPAPAPTPTPAPYSPALETGTFLSSSVAHGRGTHTATGSSSPALGPSSPPGTETPVTGADS